MRLERGLDRLELGWNGVGTGVWNKVEGWNRIGAGLERGWNGVGTDVERCWNRVGMGWEQGGVVGTGLDQGPG